MRGGGLTAFATRFGYLQKHVGVRRQIRGEPASEEAKGVRRAEASRDNAVQVMLLVIVERVMEVVVVAMLVLIGAGRVNGEQR